MDEIDAILQTHQLKLNDIRDARDSAHKNLLHVACRQMEFRVVKLLIDKYNFDPNIQDSSGDTPLHIACEAKKIQTAIYLANLTTCDPNLLNSEGLTPLHVAAKEGPALLISHLLGVERLDQSVKDPSGCTALEVIKSNPQLAAAADRKVSIGSINSNASSLPGSRKTSTNEMYSRCKLIDIRTYISTYSRSQN